MRIVCAGIYRSGTTWQFNVVRLIMNKAFPSEVWSGFSYDFTETDKPHQVIKTHKNYSHPSLTGIDFVFATHRDKQGIMDSMERRAELFKANPEELSRGFRAEMTPDNYDLYKQQVYALVYKADFIQDFRTIGSVETINHYINILGVDVDPIDILAELNKITVPTNDIDPVTLLTPFHITQ